MKLSSKFNLPSIKTGLPDFKSLKSLPLPLLNANRTALSVYVTKGIIRVLEIGSNKKPLFEPIEEVWKEESEEERVKRLSRIIESRGLKGKSVVSCITADDGMLRFQKYPKNIPKKDLIEAVEWFIKSETRPIKEETVYDYYILDEGNDKKFLKVVITIARRSAVDKLVDTLSRAGLKPKVIDYEVVSVLNFGLYNKLPLPFAILYVDYHEGIFVYYGGETITYNKLDFNYTHYKETGDETILDNFLVETRNLIVLNEVANLYVAGTVLADEATVELIMMNLPVLGLLDLESIPPSFLIPFSLSLRGLEK